MLQANIYTIHYTVYRPCFYTQVELKGFNISIMITMLAFKNIIVRFTPLFKLNIWIVEFSLLEDISRSTSVKDCLEKIQAFF